MTADAQPWTIERIHESLGSPKVRQAFMCELNKARIHEITGVFAKWQGIAEQTVAAVERARAAREAELAGEPVPGEWTDVTDEVLEAAEEIKNRKSGAA